MARKRSVGETKIKRNHFQDIARNNTGSAQDENGVAQEDNTYCD